MDAIRLSMSFGPAGSANVRITNKIVAGVSHMDVERIGFLSPRQEKRRISPWWLFKKGWEFPFVKGGAAYDEANPPSNFLVRCGRAVMRSIHKGFSHLHWRWNGGHAHERIEDECGARFFQVETGCVNRPPWEVGADAHFLLIGARAGIDLSDIGDFLAGFILWDPHDDDKGAAWGRPE
ncbi:MAG: hypothetical protein BWZ10_02890 [candidate division BRC1 bacterium ADurb.BinA364]|nr:MAG: hypothetical protein BWZ10_02890 [candidate division BRC1 bacterium ADurb.BinA364]